MLAASGSIRLEWGWVLRGSLGTSSTAWGRPSWWVDRSWAQPAWGRFSSVSMTGSTIWRWRSSGPEVSSQKREPKFSRVRICITMFRFEFDVYLTVWLRGDFWNVQFVITFSNASLKLFLFIAPYVKVYLIDGKHCVEKQKTTVARRTLDPLYQQQLAFTEDYRGKILQVCIQYI